MITRSSTTTYQNGLKFFTDAVPLRRAALALLSGRARLRASWCFQAWSLSASKANSMAATRYDASPRREVCCCSRHSTRVALCALQLILVPSRGLTCGRGRYEMDGVNVRGPASILCSRVSKMELGGATTRSCRGSRRELLGECASCTENRKTQLR